MKRKINYMDEKRLRKEYSTFVTETQDTDDLDRKIQSKT